MTLPRQVLPGSRYLVTRRCTQRQFLLRPSALANQIFAYCLALAAQRTGVVVHAFCVLTNHWHAVVTDPNGRLPEFLEIVHKLSAKCLNASLGRWENLWSTEPPSVVRLEDDEVFLDRIVYTLCNPTTAGLVAHGHEWPGLRTRPRDLAGSAKTVRRPDVFFRKVGPTPDRVALRTVAPAIEGKTAVEIAREVDERVRVREQEIRAEARRSGRSFLGRKRVLAQDPFDSPRTKEPRRKLHPRVAATDPAVRVHALGLLAEFVQNYRAAFDKWKRGIRGVLFPQGTYALRIRSAVACAPS